MTPRLGDRVIAYYDELGWLKLCETITYKVIQTSSYSYKLMYLSQHFSFVRLIKLVDEA